MSSLPPESEPTQLVSAPVPAEGLTQGAMRLVTGNQSGPSAETNRLLAERLRNVSLVLGLGFLTFLILSFLHIGEMRTVWHSVQWWSQLAVTFLVLFIAWRFCINCSHALAHLRLVELFIFGPVTLVIFFLTIVEQIDNAQRGFLVNPVAPWLMITFVYALYIPNSWRRAASVLGGIALLGVTGLWLPVLVDGQVAKVVSERPFFVPMIVRESAAIVFCYVAAVWGVRTIGKLRRQVYEAQQIGQYKLKQLLGRGGMGEVHLAEHMLLRRPCAVKLIAPEKAGDPQALVRFEREVQATAKLTHWNTIEIFDYGRTDEGVFYYVMEYLVGLNLQQVVQRAGPLPPERVIHLLSQCCDALREAHECGLIHRDIKPANIFAALLGGVHDVVKLLDFGLVRDASLVGDDAAVTRQGAIAGSPMYMSPEQVLGETLNAASDIYSLGVVGYYLLTGRVPFQAENSMRVLMAHVHEPLPRMSQFGVDVPDDLNRVILRCLDKSAEQRFQSAAELRSALEGCEHAGRWTRERAWAWWTSQDRPHASNADRRSAETATV